ncbi:CLUMA_CG017046, isoform A [Clunio marinus]|uniref:CLUMA_CG017046, isoform A n=1 Tax=Clunio marinus TaxID=568069 RepID=A0A1J1IUM9_9DIPT|nr:CLUMA_CG017046, isoform A [Clunio marinus]
MIGKISIVLIFLVRSIAPGGEQQDCETIPATADIFANYVLKLDEEKAECLAELAQIESVADMLPFDELSQQLFDIYDECNQEFQDIIIETATLLSNILEKDFNEVINIVNQGTASMQFPLMCVENDLKTLFPEMMTSDSDIYDKVEEILENNMPSPQP